MMFDQSIVAIGVKKKKNKGKKGKSEVLIKTEVKKVRDKVIFTKVILLLYGHDCIMNEYDLSFSLCLWRVCLYNPTRRLLHI